MKSKILFICCLLILLAIPSSAQMGFMQVNRASGGATECSVSTDYVGDKGEYATASNSTEDRVYCMLYTPTLASGCSSGNFATAYMRHLETSVDNIKVFTAPDDGDSVPDSGDSRNDYSAVISSSATEWASGAMQVGASNSGGNCWVCWVSDSTAFTRAYDSAGSGTLYYQDIVGSYSSLPTDLSGSWTSTASRDTSVYVTIGP